MRRAFLLLLLMVAAPVGSAARAQEAAVVQVTPAGMVSQVTLRDGSVLLGRVLEVTETTIRFASSLGETTIVRSNIASIRMYGEDRLRDGQLWPEDPSRTRLLFAPTGRMMRAGEAYLTDAYVFFPSVQVGITDRFSIGVGASILPGLDFGDNILYFTPKVGIYQSPSLNISAGALIATAKVLSDIAPVGLGYAVATVGDENDSFTGGAGFGFANGETNSLGVLMLGGSTRTTKNIALVTENYIATAANSSVFSGGVRFIGEKISVDLALWGGPSVNTVVPYVAFIYRF